MVWYGITERYFYHYSYNVFENKQIKTNELIEYSKEFYEKLISNKDNESHLVKYMSDTIPTDKKIRSILYIR